MTKTELARDMKSFTSAGVIKVSELARYLGYKEEKRVKAKFLSDLHPVTAKRYYIPEVAEAILARRFL